MAVTITIKGADETRTAFTGVIDGLDDIGKAANQATGQTTGFFSGMLQSAAGFLAANVIGSITASIGDAVGSIFSFASDSRQAIADLQTQLGITRQEAEEWGSLADEIFSNNWGDSIDDVNAAIIDVQQQFKTLGGIGRDETQELVQGTIALRDGFGGETTEYISAARTLMEQFGISGQEALDFITSGMQSGMNASGDFLDTIGEYSTQFAQGGASAEQFFSTLETGLGSGALGTDKAADLFKEFTLRITDGSKSTAESLEGIGLSASFVADQINSGAMTKADVFQLVIDRLSEMDDAVARDQLAVGLLGTQYEDLGLGAALAIDTTNTKLSDLNGATAGLSAQYDNLGKVWEGIKRSALSALQPIADSLLDIANDLMPSIQAGFESIAPVIEDFSSGVVSGIDAIMGVISTLRDAWQSDFNGIRSTVQSALGAVQSTIQTILGGVLQFWTENGAEIQATVFSVWSSLYTTIQNVVNGIWAVVQPILQILAQFWAENGAEIQATVTQVYGQIGQVIQSAMELINATVVPILQGIGSFIATHSEEIKALLVGAWDIIATIITTALSVIQGTINTVIALVQGDWGTAWENIKQVCVDIVDGIISIVETVLGTLDTVFGDALDDAIDAVTGYIQDFIDVGRDFAMGIADGFERSRQAVIDAIWGSIQGVIRWVKELLGIASPSKVTADQIGLPFMQGIVMGIQRGEAALKNAVYEIGQNLKKEIDKMGEMLQETLNGIFEDQLNANVGLVDTELGNERALASIQGDAAKRLQKLRDEEKELLAKKDAAIEALNAAQSFESQSATEAALAANEASAKALKLEQERQKLNEMRNDGKSDANAIRQQELAIQRLELEAQKKAEEAEQKAQKAREAREQRITNAQLDLDAVNQEYAALQTQMTGLTNIRDQRANLAFQTRQHLEQARQEADQLAQIDPEAAEKLYATRSRYITDLAQLRADKIEADNSGDGVVAEQLRKQITLTEQKYEAELARLNNQFNQESKLAELFEQVAVTNQAYGQQSLNDPDSMRQGIEFRNAVGQFANFVERLQQLNLGNYSVTINTKQTDQLVQSIMQLAAMNPST
jgi:phage-related minor tail protein